MTRAKPGFNSRQRFAITWSKYSLGRVVEEHLALKAGAGKMLPDEVRFHGDVGRSRGNNDCAG